MRQREGSGTPQGSGSEPQLTCREDSGARQGLARLQPLSPTPPTQAPPPAVLVYRADQPHVNTAPTQPRQALKSRHRHWPPLLMCYVTEWSRTAPANPPQVLQPPFCHMDAGLLPQAAPAPSVAAPVQPHKAAPGLLLQAHAASVGGLLEGSVVLHRVVPAAKIRRYRRCCGDGTADSPDAVQAGHVEGRNVVGVSVVACFPSLPITPSPKQRHQPLLC